MSYHLIDVIERLGHPRVLVVGDLILDRYLWGNAERVSQEAPVILLREEHQEERLGGAASVANLLRGLDADVQLAGIIGDDADGRVLSEHLQAAGVDVSAVFCDSSRPTTVKQRYMGLAQHRHPHQMLRVDREVRTPISRDVESRLMQHITARVDGCDAVLISDYAKGVCTAGLLQAVLTAAREAEKPVIVDPASTGRYDRYRNATAITPNRAETARAVGRPVSTAEEAFVAGRRLCRELQLDHCFITLDSDGMALVTSGGTEDWFPTRKREVYDITGAGDTVLATIGMGAAAGVSPADLARLANIAGGLQVEQVGVVRVTRDEMLTDAASASRAAGNRHRSAEDKIGTLEEVSRHIGGRKKLGQRIVFTNGCFDLLHPGHVRFLQEAAGHGDCLIVAVNGDESVRRLKGPRRPILPAQQRALMLAALECVDYVTIFHEDTPHAVLQKLKPHLLVKGGTTPRVIGGELVESYGGQVLTLNAHGGFSTTNLLSRIRREGEEHSDQRAA